MKKINPDFIKPEDFAKASGLSLKRIRMLIRQGDLPGHRNGNAFMVHAQLGKMALEEVAIRDAEAIAKSSRVPDIVKRKRKAQIEAKVKPRGRLPDSIRLKLAAEGP